MEEQVGPSSMMNALKDNIPHLIEKLPEMPGLIYAATKKIAEGEEHELNLVEMQKIRDEIRRGNQRTALTIAGTGLIMAGLIVYGLDGFTPAMVGGAPLISWIACGLGAFILFASLQD
jgi:ubiquinone biosynthesis protein